MGFIDSCLLSGKSAQSHHLLFVEYKNKKTTGLIPRPGAFLAVKF